MSFSYKCVILSRKTTFNCSSIIRNNFTTLYKKTDFWNRQTDLLNLRLFRKNNIISAASTMSSLPPGDKYDLVVFGATGFTGQYVVEEVARVAKLELKKTQKPLTWAIAGRSRDKLLKCLEVAKNESDFNTDDVGIIQADIKDKDSIVEMTKKAKVVINCVGPYHLYGETVVEACIKNGSSHVDISGEPVFLEGMQLKYDKKAEEAGVHIVGACGYDSVPADMGVIHMIKNFKGELNSVETYMSTRKSAGAGKTSIHTGTMESAILAMENRGAFNKIRKELYTTKLPKPKYPIEKRGVVHKNETLGIWGVTLPSDEPMVYRTQRYRHDELGLRPVQYRGFIGMKSKFAAFGTFLGMMYFVFLAYFRFTRNLLKKYPEVLTAGVFTKAGADRESLKKLSFTSTLVGQGWSQKLSEGTDEYSTPPDTTIKVKVSGPDPGYGATSLMMVACAVTILRENSACTKKGGVMTPGIAFMNTGLVDRLEERGMSFKVE